MTLEEAKEFYLKYNGREFHMGRGEPVKYREYKNLNVSDAILSQWQDELMEGYFERLWTDSLNIYRIHSRIVDNLINSKNVSEKHLARLLEEMKKMSDLDEASRTMIIETMAGRTASYRDGGVYLYYTKSKLSRQMDEVVNRMIAKGAQYTPDRFNQAVKNYRAAYEKYHR